MPYSSSFVLIEHLNFKVPFNVGEQLIREFFIDCLGCHESPQGRAYVVNPQPTIKKHLPNGTQKQMHVNLGPLSQFHFEFATGDGLPYTTSQQFPGIITLTVRDLKSIKKALTHHKYPYSVTSPTTLQVRDRLMGNTWECVLVNEEWQPPYSTRDGGYGNVLELKRLEWYVTPGTAPSIVHFYNTWFDADVQECCVYTRFGQCVAFTECKEAPTWNAYDTNPSLHGIHMCIYIHEYERIGKEMVSLYWVNPDYEIPPLCDHVRSHKEAMASQQYRIKQIGKQFTLEHEVRSIQHPRFPTMIAKL